MISERSAKELCCEDISLIENYGKAIADQTQTWHIHHRKESIHSRNDLIAIGEYYGRPASELIFLTPTEHHKLHRNGFVGKHHSEETKQKMREAGLKKKHTKETRKKMSETWKGVGWFNNGVVCVRAKKCPEGFTPGRLKLSSKSSS